MTTHAEHERQLTLANTRLNDRTAAVVQRLGARLTDVQSALELTLPSLLSEQRIAHSAAKRGEAYSPTAYWQEVAEPRAASYANEAMATIDDELVIVADAVDRFRTSVHRFSKSTNRPHNRRSTNAWIAEAIHPLLTCGPSMDQMNALGEAWQKKLHWTAVRRSLPDLLLNPQVVARDIVAHTEMELLESSPWVHGDRLLSAFELATTDIRNHLDDGLTRLAIGSQADPKPQESNNVLVLG